ncbi:hypothetical protein LBMAG21_05370 [Armatimonadota bacterium]|nr:hypothetical protein LBMAG21_05370 [Armatimonadota bacterium]
MPLVEYKPEHFELMEPIGKRSVPALCHRAHTNYYYATSPHAKLYFSTDDYQSVKAIIAIEKMPFLFGENAVTVGFGHHWHSFQPGAGGLLFMHWVKSCQVPMEFGGSNEAHELVSKMKWEYFEGMNTYFLNPYYRARPNDSPVIKLAKWGWCRAAARPSLHKRIEQIRASTPKGLYIREESAYSEDLFPKTSPFAMRFNPDLEYLNWRYNLSLAFVKYRVFRLLISGETIGYVILNEQRKRIIVSQCDATDATALAYGVLMCVAEVGKNDSHRKEIGLVSSVPAMQEIYAKFGFVTSSRFARRFALGLQRIKFDIPRDTTQWLLNYDWGDVVFRPPFLDEKEV